MQTVILGAGVLGSILGGHLARAGEEAPERIFTFQLPVLEFYLSQCTDV